MLTGITVGSLASAEEPCAPGRPAVGLHLAQFPAPLAAETTEQLRRALVRRGLALCSGEGERAKGHAAILEITSSPDGFTLTVVVNDAVTSKRVQRDIDLHDLPPDTRPLAIAQAADELLRASWAELFIEGAPRRAGEVAPEIAEAVELRPEAGPSRGSPRLPTFAAGVGMGGEFFSTGHTQLGPDVTLSYYPWRRIGAAIRLGFHASRSVHTPYGSIDSTGLFFSAGALAREALRPWLLVEGGPAFVGTRLSFEGVALAGFRARDRPAFAMHLAAEGRLSIMLGRVLHVSSSVVFGAPIRSARAVGVGTTLHEVGGLLMGGHIDLGARW